MKAVVYTRYGPPEVLRLADVPKPAPRDREVLVRVHATTVTIGDTIMRSLNLPIVGWQKVMARLILGWRRPRRAILGMELAGEIESVGRKVTRFKPGDPIFASTFAVNFGGHAEYKCLPESGVIAHQTGQSHLRGGRRRPGRRADSLALSSKGPHPTRAEDLDLRRIRRGRHVCSPACQPPLRGRCDRGVQRREPGAGAIAGRESGY